MFESIGRGEGQSTPTIPHRCVELISEKRRAELGETHPLFKS